MKDSTRVLCVMLCIVIYFSYRMGVFLQPTGGILMGGESGIYLYPFHDEKQVQVFFSNPNYEFYGDPFIQDGKFFCTSSFDKKRDERINTLFMVNSGDPSAQSGEILMQVPGEIHYPVISKDLKTVYFLRGRQLCKYDRVLGLETKVNHDSLDPYSKILLVDAQTIIYATENREETEQGEVTWERNIVLYRMDGHREILIRDAEAPAWLEEGESIFYSTTARDCYVYNILTKENTKVSDIRYTLTPVFSPDKKHYIAWSNPRFRIVGHGVQSCYVVSLNGKEEKEIKRIPMKMDGVADVWWVASDEVDKCF